MPAPQRYSRSGNVVRMTQGLRLVSSDDGTTPDEPPSPPAASTSDALQADAAATVGDGVIADGGVVAPPSALWCYYCLVRDTGEDVPVERGEV